MLGGAIKSVSKKFLKDYDSPIFIVLLGLFVLVLKTYIVQFSYNRVWPRLTTNSGGSKEAFRPLSFYEAFLVVLLFTFLL
jgi:hypothetical protein